MAVKWFPQAGFDREKQLSERESARVIPCDVKNGNASHSTESLDKPGWRKRRLRFQSPSGVPVVTVSLANPGRAGLYFDQYHKGVDPDGHSGMDLAHVWLVPIPATISAGRDNG